MADATVQKAAKRSRTIAAANLTRAEKSLFALIGKKRPFDEIQKYCTDYESKYETLREEHDAYLNTLDLEAPNVLEEQEEWLDKIIMNFDGNVILLNDYKNSLKAQDTAQDTSLNVTTSTQLSSKKTSKLKVKSQKSEAPSFSGKIIDFYEFLDDFEFIYGDVDEYTPAEAFYVLKRCVPKEAAQWLKGKSTYDEARKELLEIYGEPKLVADSFISEILKSKVACTKPEFENLYLLCSRAKRVLERKEIAKNSDLDNSTMISQIESKFTEEDRKLWARYQLEKSVQPCITGLLEFMSSEITVKRRAVGGVSMGATGSGKTENVRGKSLTITGALGTEHYYQYPGASPTPPPPPPSTSGAGHKPAGGPGTGGPPPPPPDPTVRAEKKCWVCSNSTHSAPECPKFKSMTADERLAKAREHRVCWFCLKFHKFGQACRGRKPCKETDANGNMCKFSHHVMLHGADFSFVRKKTGNDAATLDDQSEGLLPVLTSRILNPENLVRSKPVLTLLDNGANLSLIKNSVAEELGLPGEPITVSLGKVGGDRDEFRTKLYTLFVQSIVNTVAPQRKIQAVGIEEVCGEIPDVDVEVYAKMFGIEPKALVRGSGHPELLIGNDYVKFHAGHIETTPGNIAVRYSILGPVVFGQEQTENADAKSYVKSGIQATVIVRPKIDLSSFISAEEMGIAVNPCCVKRQNRGQKILPPQEKLEEQEIRNSAIYLSNEDKGRWMIPIPCAEDPSNIPNNYKQVEMCLYSLENRLEQKGAEEAEKYNEQIEELVKTGCAMKITESDQAYDGPIFYLNHHAVCRDSASTPVRPVFDAKKKFKNRCLNDYQKKGPDLLNDQLKVMVRFREHSVAIDGDAKRMYHQVRIRPVYDGNLHRFLWRNFDRNRKPDIYKMIVLSFGDKCSPALANIAMNMTAEKFAEKYPDAVESILESRYMDDFLDSFETEDIAAQRIEEIDEILETGHFHIKEWISNSENLPVSKPTTKIKSLSEDHEEKVLGLGWNVKRDTLHLVTRIPKILKKNSVSPHDWPHPPVLTKRIVLSITAEIYDPIGYGGPFILRAKIQLQELWRRKLSWDADLPTDLKEFWYDFISKLDSLGKSELPRCLTPENATGKPSMIIFCDACVDCFGAVAYARWLLDSGEFSSRFIMSRNRVAPLKALSIPQLELNSCVVAARICDTVSTYTRLDFEKTWILPDSRIALAWIKSESRSFTPFVSVRVGEIQMKTPNVIFQHIPSQYNVCDDLVRGLQPEELISGRWCTGDDFLAAPEEKWPTSEDVHLNENEKKMMNDSILKKANVQVATLENVYPEEYIAKFSSYKRAIRVTAIRDRFLHNLKAAIHDKKSVKKGEITIEEFEDARTRLIRDAQCQLRQKKNALKTKPLKNLCPMENENGVLVIRGRTDNLVSFENYRPPILPNNSGLSRLIVHYYHSKRGHDSPAALAAKVRRDFWIIGVNRIAKSVYTKCVFCKEVNAKTQSQIMASLPPERLLPISPPWLNTAVDYFGPITVKYGRNKTAKAYGVIFTCLMVRSVYIDVAENYSTAKFQEVLRRFVSRCGQPRKLFSDRGSQLVGCDQELRRMVQGHLHDELKKFCHEQQMEWNFFTPSAPHQNGITESMVKITKKKLKQVLGETRLTPLELQTVCFEIAQLINQRPIGRLPNHPDDGHYLAPNDLLLGRASATVPQGPFFETKSTKYRFEYIQNIVESWWRAWYRDVFANLVPRKKWQTAQRDVQVNDYVLVKDTNPIRGHYSRGIITATFEGSDGRVRNVKVRTVDGTYQRPITKIVVLLPADAAQDD